LVLYTLTKVGSNRTPISHSCHRTDRAQIKYEFLAVLDFDIVSTGPPPVENARL